MSIGTSGKGGIATVLATLVITFPVRANRIRAPPAPPNEVSIFFCPFS